MQAYEGMKGTHLLCSFNGTNSLSDLKNLADTVPAIRDSSGQIRIFRPDKHAVRMRHSCACVSIPPISDEHFIRCVSLAVSLNAEFVPPSGAPAMLYVRPLALGTGPQVNIVAPSEFTFCVFALPSAALLGASKPVAALVLEDFDRAAPRGTGSAKIGGNYAPVMRWQRRAKEEGFATTLHLDSLTRSEVEEFSAAGFIGVTKGPDLGYTLTVPDSASVIKSVTSDTCLELARDMGWKVEVRPVGHLTLSISPHFDGPISALVQSPGTNYLHLFKVKYDELHRFDEVLAVGTAAIVVPIKSITRKSTSDTVLYGCDVAGNTCFKALFEKVLDAQAGTHENGRNWSVVVQDATSYGFTELQVVS